MAKLHSKKKGKAGTKRPKTSTAPKWVNIKKKELEDIIVKMAKEGVPSSKIGLILRDQYNVPNAKALLDISISNFLKSENCAPQIPDDLMSLIKKALRMRAHLKSFNKDVHNKVKLDHVESKIERLAKHYRATGILAKEWRYDPEQASLIAK